MSGHFKLGTNETTLYEELCRDLRWFIKALDNEEKLSAIGLDNINPTYARAAISAHITAGFLVKGAQAMSTTKGVDVNPEHVTIRALGNFYNLLYLGAKYYLGVKKLPSDLDVDEEQKALVYAYKDVSVRILNQLRNDKGHCLTELVGAVMDKVATKRMDPVQSTMAGYKACIDIHKAKLDKVTFSILLEDFSISALDSLHEQIYSQSQSLMH